MKKGALHKEAPPNDPALRVRHSVCSTGSVLSGVSFHNKASGVPCGKCAITQEFGGSYDSHNVRTTTEMDMIAMIVTFTDFGSSGPYLGQMHLALRAYAKECPIIDLLSNAPMGNPKASAYLLDALVPYIPIGAIVLGVVDPGVGGNRPPVIVQAKERWYVGPGNGLFEMVGRGPDTQYWQITWQPPHLSTTFHGRDLFAPVAAKLAQGQAIEDLAERILWDGFDWPQDLAEVIFVDHYGNAMTGLRGQGVNPDSKIQIAGYTLSSAQRFDQVPVGQAFWYVNSCGLIEIAINQGNAAQRMAIDIGHSVACTKI